jgi:polyribonucleotide nucleotidyltransferase
MMAAGVPVKKQVAGIAMGLIKEGDDVVILSDILGDEDHLGDMDFKVTGTDDGICAYQMDIKIQGISIEIMKKALDQAKQGRKHILGIMNATIDKPRAELSEHAPRILNYKIAADEIGLFVGPGGKNIKGIIAQFGVKIDVDDNGYIKILSDGENGEAALKHIQTMFAKPEIGVIYDGVVRGVKPFGVFVEIMPRIEGLVHVSELSLERITNVEEHFKMGDKLQVKYIGTDKEGRIKLVRKELLKEAEGK